MAKAVTVTVESNVKLAREELERALTQWAEEVGGDMVNLTHRDKTQGGTPVDTGRLRNSMAHSAARDHRTVYVGTNVEYAEPVEEGARGRSGAHMLRNAVMDEKDHATEFLKFVLENQ